MAGNMESFKIIVLLLFILRTCFRVHTISLTGNSSIETYIKLCGNEKLCGKYGTRRPNLPLSKLHCSECDCDSQCYIKGTCCPDLHLNTCVNISLLSASPSERSATFVYLLSNCPSSANDGKCESAPVAPVRGLPSNVSYRNIYCAWCNGEENVLSWGFAVEECTRENFDINIYSKLNSIYNGVADFGCNFVYDWTIANADVRKCSKRNIDSCNVTGLWDRYDRDIELACKINDNPYTFFSNIFCFICNTGLHTDETLVDNCPIGSKTLVSKLCESEKEDPRWFPYKNTYCRDCSYVETFEFLQQYYNFNSSSPYPYELTLSIANNSHLICDLQNLPQYRFLQSSEIVSSLCSIDSNKRLNERIKDLDSTFDNITSVRNASRTNIDFTSLYKTYAKFGGMFSWCFNGSEGCYCTEDCYVLRNCCPDKIGNSRYQCKKYKDERLAVLATCPSPFHDNVVRYYCEREDTSSGTVVDLIPIAHYISGKPVMQYKNIFCFMCNYDINERITEMQYWYARTFKFRCPKYISTDYSVMSTQTFFYLEKLCDLKVQITNAETEVGLDCGSLSLYPAPRVFSCPSVSRQYPHKNDIIYLCETAGIMILAEKCTNYANFFCEICNYMKDCESDHCVRKMQRLHANTVDCNKLNPSIFIKEEQCEFCVDYRHLFTIFERQATGESSVYQKECDATETLDPRTENCRTISCYDGKEYRDGCKSLLSRSQNLRYEMTLTIIFNSTIFQEGISSDQMIQILLVLAEKIIEKLESLPHIVVYHMSCENMLSWSDNYLQNILTSFRVRMNTTGVVSRDKTEEELFLIQAELETMQTDNIINDIAITRSPEKIAQNKGFDLENICKNVIPRSTKIKGNVFKVDKFLTCAQFILHENEYLIEKGYLYLTANLAKRKSIIFTRDRTNLVRVCISDYLSLFSAKKLVTWLTFWDILPTICVCISMLCLFLTIITYCVLKQYRTLPGKNILCLMISQFLAQTILLIKNIRVDDTYCMIIAAITHYTWLTMFIATANCTIHMYMAFNMNFATWNKKKAILFSLTTILSVPMLIVGVYLVYVFTTSGSYPYQTSTCFIEDFVPLIVFFHVPVSIVCLIDLVFFILIAYHLHTLTYIRSNQDRRNNSIICLKLFLVTGLSWIVQLVESFFQIPSFTYAVSVLNGCQGIFIFIVLILSKNIRVALVTSRSSTEST